MLEAGSACVQTRPCSCPDVGVSSTSICYEEVRDLEHEVPASRVMGKSARLEKALLEYKMRVIGQQLREGPGVVLGGGDWEG